MYKIIKFSSDGLMITQHPRYGQQLWTLCKLTKRHKNDECAICELSVGDHAFRPMSNLGNRYKRICQRHLTQRAADRAKVARLINWDEDGISAAGHGVGE